MICAWDALIGLLPMWMRDDVDKLGERSLQELRLRIGKPPELVLGQESIHLGRTVTKSDIQFVINIASGYSPWAAETLSHGYITAAGGHRIGVCGDAIKINNDMRGVRNPEMLCIRVARDFHNIVDNIPLNQGSVLIIGKPGSGKTTLLRALIRTYSNSQKGSIGVVDERGELFPKWNGTSCFDTGPKTDILTGCLKVQGIEMLIRCMGPTAVAVDEITSPKDCDALMQAAWCGVTLFATAHAGGKEDLFARPVYKTIVKNSLFPLLVTIQSDKSWKLERID